MAEDWDTTATATGGGAGYGEEESIQEVNRIELAAALLDYDVPSPTSPSYDTRPTLRATQSAILSPYKHILLRTNSYSESPPAAASPLPTDQTVNSSNWAQFAPEGEEAAKESDQDLMSEWGLSQVGSPALQLDGAGRERKDAFLSTKEGGAPFAAEDKEELMETRSLPDLSTFSTPVPEPQAPKSRIKILERRGRTKSLVAFSTLDLNLFDSSPLALPSFVDPTPSTSRPISSYSTFSVTSNPLSPAPAPSDHPISKYSTQPRPSTSLSNYTSRFDPHLIAVEKEEREKDRPRFKNEEAGRPPKVVRMPMPLAGQPLSAPPKLRVEGPDSDSESEKEEEEEVVEVKKEKERPPGALYGRSLLDVLEERKIGIKNQSRTFIQGSTTDSRQTRMVDLSPSPSSPSTSPHPQSLTPHNPQKISRTVSVFGPDLIYQREMEKRLAEEKEEEKERELEEEREREVWEKDRVREEEKRKGALRRLEGRPVTPAGIQPEAVSRHSGFEYEYVPQPPPPTEPRERKHSVAPSLSLPQGLEDRSNFSAIELFPPQSPASDSDTDSSGGERIERAGRRESVEEQLMGLRTAVMLGSMTPSEAAHRASLLNPSLPGSGSSDRRPLGEHFTNPSSNFNALPTSGPGPCRTELPALSFSPNVGLGETAFSPPMTPKEEYAEDDDDDIPLGLKARAGGGREDEDDVPLGLVHPRVAPAPFPAATGGGDDDDDLPLAFSAAPQLHNQQYYFAQQAAQYQAEQQAAMQWAYHHQQQQQQQLAQEGMSGMERYMINADAQFNGMNGGGGVDRWRHGVS